MKFISAPPLQDNNGTGKKEKKKTLKNKLQTGASCHRLPTKLPSHPQMLSSSQSS